MVEDNELVIQATALDDHVLHTASQLSEYIHVLVHIAAVTSLHCSQRKQLIYSLSALHNIHHVSKVCQPILRSVLVKYKPISIEIGRHVLQ